MDRLLQAASTAVSVSPAVFSVVPTFFLALLISLALVPAVAAFARRIGWMDRPGGIKTHENETPYGGGLGLVLATLASLMICHPQAWPEFATGLLGASMLVFAGGIWDDFHPMGFVSKFLVQSTAAAIVLLHGIHIDIKLLPPLLDYVLTVIWLVGITNAVNIIDIMDGLAGGVCGIVALTFGLIGLLFGDSVSAYLGFALSGAVAGFLRYNFHPARIFMGDAGAQLLGFVLGVLAVLGAYTNFNKIALLAPVLALGVPLFDTVLVIVIRLAKRASPFLGSPDHFALRLRAIGYSVPATVRIVLLTTLVLSIAALLATLVPLAEAVAIYATTFVFAVAFGAWIARVKVS